MNIVGRKCEATISQLRKTNKRKKLSWAFKWENSSCCTYLVTDYLCRIFSSEILSIIRDSLTYRTERNETRKRGKEMRDKNYKTTTTTGGGGSSSQGIHDAVAQPPTSPFTILQPRNREIGEFYVLQECRATDLQAPRLWNGRSGQSDSRLRRPQFALWIEIDTMALLAGWDGVSFLLLVCTPAEKYNSFFYRRKQTNSS